MLHLKRSNLVGQFSLIILFRKFQLRRRRSYQLFLVDFTQEKKKSYRILTHISPRFGSAFLASWFSFFSIERARITTGTVLVSEPTASGTIWIYLSKLNNLSFKDHDASIPDGFFSLKKIQVGFLITK
jgi:hypothetical protein